MAESIVYINWGRFIAECACGDAREVTPGQTSDTCFNGHPLTLVWPDGIESVVTALAGREERRRNWFPAGHPVAVATGQPNGETPAELADEQAAFEQQEAADKTAQVAAALADLGLGFNPETGQVEGL